MKKNWLFLEELMMRMKFQTNVLKLSSKIVLRNQNQEWLLDVRKFIRSSQIFLKSKYRVWIVLDVHLFLVTCIKQYYCLLTLLTLGVETIGYSNIRNHQLCQILFFSIIFQILGVHSISMVSYLLLDGISKRWFIKIVFCFLEEVI